MMVKHVPAFRQRSMFVSLFHVLHIEFRSKSKFQVTNTLLRMLYNFRLLREDIHPREHFFLFSSILSRLVHCREIRKVTFPAFLPGTLPFATIGPLHYVISATGSLEGNRKERKKKKEERAASGPMQTSEVGRPPKVSLSSESWETLLPKGFSIWFIDTKISIFLLGKFPLLRFHGHRIAVFLSSLLSMTLQEWKFSLLTLPMLISDFVVDQLGSLYFVGPPDASRPRPSPITMPYTRN